MPSVTRLGQGKCEKRAKGVGKKVVNKQLSFGHYDKCVRENRVYNTQFVTHDDKPTLLTNGT